MPPGTMFVNTNWSPTDSAMSRPAFFRRSCSGVFGIAFSMPVIEIGIRACWMKRNCSSKMAGSSLSKPTIMPAITSMPAAWIRWTAVTMSSRVFCALFDSSRLAFRGDSMPTKIVVKRARFMRASSSSSCATLRLTSVMNSTG